MSHPTSLNMTSASGAGFLSGWYCCQTEVLVSAKVPKTHLDGELAVCLFEPVVSLCESLCTIATHSMSVASGLTPRRS